MSAPRALLLDALGTLVELEPPVAPLRAELRARFGIELGEREAAVAVRTEIAYYRAHHDEARDPESLALLRRRSAEALRAALPAEHAELPLAPLTDALLAALRFCAFPEVAEVLRAAGERGLPRIVVSNWDVSLHGVLADTGLAPLLDGVVTSAELGSAKPAPEPFAAGLALAGVAAADALHVGDSLEEDVAGARAAGVPALLLVRDGEEPPADVAAIRSLRELPGLDG